MAWTGIMNKLRGLLRGTGRKRKTAQTAPLDRAMLEEYLEQLIQELNLRLLCQTGAAQSGRTLWVREITVTEYSEDSKNGFGKKRHRAERQKER